jgi:hypothetical protein
MKEGGKRSPRLIYMRLADNEEGTSMWISPDLVTIPIEDSKGRLLPSKLGTQLAGKFIDHLEYSNEVDIQQYVRHMVGDAITALGLGGVLNDHVEVALYGIIPDVIVVRIHGRVIFFIEVKCPDNPKGSDTVFTSNAVAGQVYSYAMALLQHGNIRPTGALMTYNKMCLVSLRDMKDDLQRKTLIEKTIPKLKINFRETVHLGKDYRNESCNPNSSPSRTQKELESLVNIYVAKTVPKNRKQDVENRGEVVENTEDNTEKDVENKKKDVEIEMDGNVSYSRIYQGAEIFPALLQALQLAFDDSLSMDIDEHLPIARHKDSLGGRLFLKGSDGCTKFVVTKSTLEADANNFPPKNSKTFYLLAQLGTGKAGTTYLACNSSGRLCAVKMHIPHRSVAATADDRELERNNRYEEEEIRRDQELSRWDALCESNPAFGVKLCGNPCLVMPYGIEIPSDERTDTRVQAKIKDLLTTFAKKGFSYKELRWRHILRDYNNNLFLVDLESLESLTDPAKSTKEKWVAYVVKEQVDELLKKAATATPSRAETEPEPDEDAVVLVEVAPATHKRKR